MKTHTVFAQAWEESERGWGIRPDGASLHKSLEDCKAFRAEFWRQERERNPSGIAPNEYTRESGQPHLVEVGDDLYAQILASKNGIWIAQSEYRKLERHA
jgi:hypothetical protein